MKWTLGHGHRQRANQMNEIRWQPVAIFGSVLLIIVLGLIWIIGATVTWKTWLNS
jgi:hypothetical protein